MKSAILIALLSGSSAFANDSTRTLPKGIFGVRLSNVFVTGANYQFGADGNKGTIADIHATPLRGQMVRQVSEMGNNSTIGGLILKQVVSALQNSTAGQALINSLDLGQMKTDITPTAHVFAPTIMYGVTNSWSMIVNVPFIRLKTDVAWQYVPGSSTALLNAVSSAANVVGVTAIPDSSQFVPLAHKALAEKGYKPLESGEKSFVGDSRLNNLFALGHVGPVSFGAMNTLGLPTGPKHDPNDLLDPGDFHHTFIEQEVTMVYAVTRKFQLYSSGGVRYYLPEKTDFRVPTEEADLNPDPGQIETLTRQVGLGKWAEAGLKYRVLSRFGVSAGVVHLTREADKFSGNRGLRYDLLEKTYPYNGTETSSFKLGLTYDPLSNYRPGSIPLMVDLNYEEVFAGTNAPATKQLMLSFSTYF